MGPLETWEKILLGLLAAGVVVWLWPGVKASLQQSQRAEAADWKSAALVLGAVVLFVLFLVALL
jgi:hypothetical protein